MFTPIALPSLLSTYNAEYFEKYIPPADDPQVPDED